MSRPALPALPAPINGDYDIPMPEDEEPITSDFGRLESPCHVVTMEEQRRIAADLAHSRYKASGALRRDEDWRAVVAQVRCGDAA